LACAFIRNIGPRGGGGKEISVGFS